MLNLRCKRVFGLALLLIYAEITVAAEITQTWTLSDPKPVESGKPAPPQKKKSPDSQAQAHSYTRTEAAYTIPNLPMVDKTGNDVDLRQLIDYGGPVMIQFIFASCSTICPVLSASFARAQPELDALAGGVYRLISISIDPEQDTPERLAEYGRRFKAGNNWYFLTGDRDNVVQILKAFDASYAGNNKMYHKSLTFIRSGIGANWIRIEGLMGKNDIVTEYKNTVGISAQ